MAANHELQALLKKVKLTPHDILVEVFSELLTTAWPILEDSRSASIWSSLSSLGSGDKSASKPKAPPRPKKKAPPPKKSVPQHVTLSHYYPLFWTVVSGPKPEGEDQNDEFLNRMCRLFRVEIPSVKQTLSDLGNSLFSGDYEDEAQRQLVHESSSLLDEWFKREKTVVSYRPIATKLTTIRQSALSSNLAQRIGIMLHSLKRAISPTATLHDVKLALLGCTLKKEYIILLTEVVPNEDDAANLRRVDEWKSGAAAVAQLMEDQPELSLAEDEEFILFVSAFPNFFKRLQIMYIMAAFLDIQRDLVEKLSIASHAIRMLLGHGAVKYVWKLVLTIGNELNRDTSRGGQPWFRLSAIRRVNYWNIPYVNAQVLEVRGNRSMTLQEYLAGYTGMLFETQEWRLLQKAKDICCAQIYSSATDVLETYELMFQPTDKSKIPDIIKEGECLGELLDQFHICIGEFAQKNIQTARRLLHGVVEFRHWYYVAAYYFCDPASLLPLESALEGDADSEDSPARDFFTRMWYFMTAIRAKVPTTRISLSFAWQNDYIKNKLPKSFQTLPEKAFNQESIEVFLANQQSKMEPENSPTETKKRISVNATFGRRLRLQKAFAAQQEAEAALVSKQETNDVLPGPPSRSVESSPKSIITEDNPFTVRITCTDRALPVNRPRRFGGFRGGSRLLNDEASMQRLREKLMLDQTSVSSTVKTEEIIGILAPRGPPRKRRPRSSIDATFSLAMHVGK